jgi:hypothetical protein
MIRGLLTVVGGLFVLIALLVLTVFFYPRPVDHTPAWVFEGNAADINYCELPLLDNSGLMASDIAQGHTPGCGYDQFPQPILRGCTETLSAGATDLRGLWQQIGAGGFVDHVERIEQCGNRVVVTSSGVIHDLTTDDDLAGASNDIEPFTIAGKRFCHRSSATTAWKDGRLEFYALGGPRVVQRYLEGDELVWEYPGAATTRMKRICQLLDRVNYPPWGKRPE